MFLEIIVLAIILDLLIGDPSCYPHPVRIIGSLITKFESMYRNIIAKEVIAGFLTVLSVLSTIIIALSILFVVANYIGVTNIISTLLIYTCIAIKDLRKEALGVYTALDNRENINVARMRISRIVGRDTENLDRQGIVRACVETVAENLADGVIAPLFWAFVGALFAYLCGLNEVIISSSSAVIYKAINTMDSMLGYKNERYINFGRIAAKLDDLFNYIPARITALCLVLAAYLSDNNGKQALSMLRRDCRKHASPNAGYPEAAMAGILGVRLCGPSYYFGTIVDKDYIGDNLNQINQEDIKKTNNISFLATIIFVSLSFGLIVLCSM
ncbi:MAG: adenosylcobinamide-phosphate synthase CbiB [Desulfotalea sp.]